jgi:hypothetical protein
MQNISDTKIRVNDNGVLVEAQANMAKDDVDGLYIVHFACLEDDEGVNFRFSVLATINVTAIQSEEQLYSQTSEVWSIPLKEKTDFDKARIILARMVKDGLYYQKTTYKFPDKEDTVRADKIEIAEIVPELNKILDALRERQE